MTLLLVIPGIWLFVMYAVAVPALLLERVGPVQSLKRSYRLVKGRWWATFGTLLVSTVLAGIVGALRPVGDHDRPQPAGGRQHARARVRQRRVAARSAP